MRLSGLSTSRTRCVRWPIASWCCISAVKLLDGAPAEVMASPLVREIYMGLPADAA